MKKRVTLSLANQEEYLIVKKHINDMGVDKIKTKHYIDTDHYDMTILLTQGELCKVIDLAKEIGGILFKEGL